MTWNVEKVKNNIFMLKSCLDLEKPALVFLSEPQIFQSDIEATMSYVRGEYCYYLNSDDTHDSELPMVKNHSGWHTSFVAERY